MNIRADNFSRRCRFRGHPQKRQRREKLSARIFTHGCCPADLSIVSLETYPCSAIFCPTLAFPALLSCPRHPLLVRAPAIVVSSIFVHHSVLEPWLSANSSLSTPRCPVADKRKLLYFCPYANCRRVPNFLQGSRIFPKTLCYCPSIVPFVRE